MRHAQQGPETRAMLVFDTPMLNHCALADRLDDLRELVLDYTCATTTTVLAELRAGAPAHPELSTGLNRLDWLHLFALDRPEEHERLKEWLSTLGTDPTQSRNRGEASVFAVADVHGVVAMTDDGPAIRVGRRYGLEVHGTVWLLAGACRAGKLTETGAGALIESLRETGHRLPCTGPEFPHYARRHGLL